MSVLSWDRVKDRLFEAGLDRGVLYPSSIVGIPGVAWNGLTSVEIDPEAKNTTPLYYDGYKTFDLVESGDFSATMRALTYPDEFIKYDGYSEFAPGLFLDSQYRDTFGLSYRTFIGDQESDLSLGYKIHVLYNLTAVVEPVTHQTVSSNVDPIEFSWKLTSIPEDVPNHKPTAHVVVDSTKVSRSNLKTIEDTLYGTDSTEPRLVTITEFMAMVPMS